MNLRLRQDKRGTVFCVTAAETKKHKPFHLILNTKFHPNIIPRRTQGERLFCVLHFCPNIYRTQKPYATKISIHDNKQKQQMADRWEEKIKFRKHKMDKQITVNGRVAFFFVSICPADDSA
jgi:hypothetical protein